MTGKIERRGDVFHFVGAIDEHVDWSSVGAVGGALRCDFGEMIAINSIAIAKFITLLQQYGHGKLEYYRCPIILLNTINAVSKFLGAKRDPMVVKSAFIEYQCTVCRENHWILIPMSLVQKSGNQMSLPPRQCPKCGSVMRLLSDLEDDLAFFLQPDVRP
jgi:hypothetical protein